MREGLLTCHLCNAWCAPPSRKVSPTVNSPNNPSIPEATNSAIPSAAQLAETRLKRWHQQGEALLTMENLRSWMNTSGLVLFVPRTQIASPAPTMVEAVLGESIAVPTLEQTTEARSLLARLVAEGLAVPLNLLGAGPGTVHAGAPGDTPDFVASTAVFSYIFTLRGDKAWKQPPATTGPFKVSPLALATFEALSRNGPLSAYNLTTEVGKEVTEAAILRALGELWTHLRVLPQAQPDGAATVWELCSARFTKQIKAGANAGQPTALSALISLYLGQAVVASEDEIESFLSPLASRSRIRDVIHALLSARQLDTVAVEGRTMLYVAGSLPAFLAPEAPVTQGEAQETAAAGDIAVDAEATEPVEDGDTPRITKFIPKPRKIGTGYLAKAKPSEFASGAKPGPFERGTKGFGAKGFGAKPGFGSKPGFKPRDRSGPAPDRQRRPFSKPAAPGAEKSGGYDKPWEEEKAKRLASAARPSQVSDETERTLGEGETPRSPRKSFSKPGTFGRKREGFGTRPGARPSAGGDARPARKNFSSRSEGRPDGGQRPAFGSPRTPGSYAPRPPGGAGFKGKPSFSKPAGFSKSRESFGDKKYSDKPFVKRAFQGKPKAEGERNTLSESGKRVYRKFDAPRDRPARPFSSDRSARPARADGESRSAGKPAGDFAPRKFAGKPFAKPGGFGAKKPYTKPDGFAGKKPFGKTAGDFKPRKFAGKSSSKPGGFGAKKPYSKAGTAGSGRPASTFAKFADNKKPFGKRPPARKFKSRKDESAG